MKILTFDTEATGISDGQVCQLSYLIEDGDTLLARNFYFTVNEMSAGAQDVHGLSMETLADLSNGRVFADDARQIEQDFSSVDVLVGHNVDFDVRYVQKELSRCDINMKKTNTFCTMNYFTPILGLVRKLGPRPKPPRLEELVEFFEITPEEVTQRTIVAFGAGEKPHDARWDTMATYLCLKEALKKGHIRKL